MKIQFHTAVRCMLGSLIIPALAIASLPVTLVVVIISIAFFLFKGKMQPFIFWENWFGKLFKKVLFWTLPET